MNTLTMMVIDRSSSRLMITGKSISNYQSLPLGGFSLLMKQMSLHVHLPDLKIGTERSKAYIPHTNRVQGPYCKIWTKFFPVDLWPARFTLGP